MKFDRTDPMHWVRAAWLVAVSVVASFIAWIRGPSPARTVVLSGHHLNGNLAALADTRNDIGGDDEWCYLAMSSATTPRDCPLDVLRMWRVRDCVRLARSAVVVTDHGPGLLSVIAALRPQIVLIDVWHGVGFKALGSSYSRMMRRYSLLVAASEWDRENQIADAGMDPGTVSALGYPLVDRLVDARGDLPERGRILIAPTWSHGEESEFPGLLDAEILDPIASWAEDSGITLVVRAHLNASVVASVSREVMQRPMADWPDTVAELTASDVVVTDWSSIASDFNVLGRPIIYWDSPAPFSAYRLVPDDRIGPRVQTAGELIEALETALESGTFEARFGDAQRALVHRCHGAALDGAASRRVIDAIREMVPR